MTRYMCRFVLESSYGAIFGKEFAGNEKHVQKSPNMACMRHIVSFSLHFRHIRMKDEVRIIRIFDPANSDLFGLFDIRSASDE